MLQRDQPVPLEFNIKFYPFSSKRKRTEDVDEKQHVKLEKPNNVCENNPVLPKIIKAPNFKIYNFEEKGIKKSKLFVFNVEDKSMGYEYYWSASMKSYRCSRCEKRGKNSTAKICKRSGGNDFIEVKAVKHICEMIKYDYGKYNFDASKQIIKEPNFEVHDFQDRGILRKWLVIFPLIEDRSKCYEYSWIKRDKKYECRGCKAMKINVFAELCQNKNGTKYVKLGPQKHGCEYRKYNPQKFTSEEIVEAQNFEIVNFEENGISKKRLFIFTYADKTKCYEFYWRNTGKYFTCSPCEIKNKHTAAKLEERKDGTNYIRLLSPKHICEVKDYVPEKYSFDESKRIVEKPNFEIYDYVKNDVSKSMLIIFCATNKELCYEYFWEKHGQVYVCCGCANIIHVTAKLCKNENGEEYLKLNKSEHVCELRPYEPQKFIDNLKIDKSDYETSEYSYNGISSKRLFIFATKSKEFCYKFYYNSTENFYYCSKCRQMNQHLKAHIRENDDVNEYVSVSSKKHICEPIKYNPKKQILSQNFQLLKRKSRNLIIKKLIVFIDPNHEMCYEYRQSETYFVCASSSKFKCPASAKMLQDSAGKDYVEMSYVKHKCKPIKFIPEGNLDFKIIKKPDFKLDGNVLSIFDKNDKTKCYTYKWKEHGKLYQCYSCRYKNESVSVVARIKQNEDGEDYVLLNDNEHFCQPKKYQPLKK
uniref:C2H2-type domain-containing protein n=1 Tax=Panagrolaimus davidi TaxID=227884 RepID=A0A914PZM9_9BILA